MGYIGLSINLVGSTGIGANLEHIGPVMYHIATGLGCMGTNNLESMGVNRLEHMGLERMDVNNLKLIGLAMFGTRRF